jgi:formylglycine-generating enzyme required for sulfatase activity
MNNSGGNFHMLNHRKNIQAKILVTASVVFMVGITACVEAEPTIEPRTATVAPTLTPVIPTDTPAPTMTLTVVEVEVPLEELSGKFWVGDHQLYIQCMGSGSPTVVFEAGWNDAGETWSLVQPEVAKYTRACAYDRVGLGESDPGPEPGTYLQAVIETHVLLGKAGIEDPYILVGHSLGGMYMLLYTHQYPNEVVGLVLVDSSHPDSFERNLAVMPPESPDDSESVQFYREWFSTTDKDPTLKPEHLVPGSLGDLPLVVLTVPDKQRADDVPVELSAQFDQIWVELHEGLALMSSNSTHIIVEDSSHFIQHDQPQVVIEAILKTMETVNENSESPPGGEANPDTALIPPADAELGDIWTRPSDGMQMVYVPGGSFQMGSTTAQVEVAGALCNETLDRRDKCDVANFIIESPQHTVTLDAYWIDRYEVTNVQYELCVGDGVCERSRLANNAVYNGDDYPVAGIPWADAADYCTWAGGRLPSEAEWEYAARGEGGFEYPWGDEFKCSGGNFYEADTGCEDSYAEPAPVGSFPEGISWVGAFDMAGNVWEWVADSFAPYPESAQTNPVNDVAGDKMVLRGGSWGYSQAFVRTAYRYPVPPSADYLAVGFRCAFSTEKSASFDPPPGSLGDSWSRPMDGMEMVYVPGGSFDMGSVESDPYANPSEFPQHRVSLGGFWIDRTEVTNAHYQRCLDAGVCVESRYAHNPVYNGDDYPVVGITWQAAMDYCAWVGGRLPSESEWEYAARGEGGVIYPWGDEFDGRWVNYCDSNCQEAWADPDIDDGYEEIAPVGTYLGGMSWVGALDMAGNVWEWVGDWYEDYTAVAQVNPSGPENGNYKIIRGGCWANGEDGVRTAYRLQDGGEILPSFRHPNIGFRCVVPGSANR